MGAMKGLVTVDVIELHNLLTECLSVYQNYNKDEYMEESKVWSWKKFKSIKVLVHHPPFWYSERHEVLQYINQLCKVCEDLIKKDVKDIQVSLNTYNQLLLLRDNRKDFQPLWLTRY